MSCCEAPPQLHRSTEARISGSDTISWTKHAYSQSPVKYFCSLCDHFRFLILVGRWSELSLGICFISRCWAKSWFRLWHCYHTLRHQIEAEWRSFGSDRTETSVTAVTFVNSSTWTASRKCRSYVKKHEKQKCQKKFWYHLWNSNVVQVLLCHRLYHLFKCSPSIDLTSLQRYLQLQQNQGRHSVELDVWMIPLIRSLWMSDPFLCRFKGIVLSRL